MEIKFLAKKTKQGNSNYALIPKGIADLLENKQYEFVIREVK